MDGYEATKAIRKAECELRRVHSSRMRNKAQKDTDAGDQRPVPIIALTGNNIEAEMEKCRDLGMNDFIGKSLFRDQLLTLIKKWTTTEPVCLASGKAQNHASNPNASKSSVHQPIDLDRALNEFLGEKEILDDLPKEFIEKVYSQIESIRQATLNQDYKVIAREAHSIKGGAANLAADRVAGSASDLEKAAELAQVEPVRHLVGRLEENLKQLENYLQNLILSIPGIGK
jgi:HPt (histidine-containing phosphotransfer) domain-containing protein